ncbi:MAG: DNA integrity scanning diadenylate cyclase DisA [Candidatus Hydrogenedentes bacterium]|nr:DNA integrity scanning diadenylate cyclase DisA [Candidatus Hydrogenedentota bacterium]
MARTERKNKKVMNLYLDVLRMLAPGTDMREELSYFMPGPSAALLVLSGSKKVERLTEGGFTIDQPFSPTYLYELAKMDGAIVLDESASRILRANVFLAPSRTVPSQETGTRHRAAERMARQTGTAVITVSERRSSLTLYVGHIKHVMDNIATLLNKAAQSLQAIEKYLESVNRAYQELSLREFQEMVTIYDVCRTVQRAEMLRRLVSEIEPYILELGTEGRLIELQLNELIANQDFGELLIRDYYKRQSGLSHTIVTRNIRSLTSKDLISLNNICAALGYGPNMRNVETYLTPCGYRILNQIQRIPPQTIEHIVRRFGSLPAILRASREELVAVESVGEVMAERVRVGLDLLRNQLAMDVR